LTRIGLDQVLSDSFFEEGSEKVTVALPAGAVSNRSQAAVSTAAAAPARRISEQNHLRNGFSAFTEFSPAAGVSAAAKQASSEAARAPLARFEALVLQTFIQSMLPKDAECVYGKGLSGDMWQSMLAEKIAEQVTQRGGIGIAARLAKDYSVHGGA
jgi:peptidoglycan hydrolase FlgJ